MAFIETPRFPEEVSAWMVGGEEFSTTVNISTGGFETRNAAWSRPLRKYSIGGGQRAVKNADATRAFFRAAAGRLNGFRVRDRFDCSATVAEGVMVEVAPATSHTVYQLAKNYGSGAIATQSKVNKPVAGTVSIYQNGVLASSGYTLDTTTGIVTFAATQAGVTLTWSGQFDVPVRFDTDWLQISMDAGGLLSWASITLIELRNP